MYLKDSISVEPYNSISNFRADSISNIGLTLLSMRKKNKIKKEMRAKGKKRKKKFILRLNKSNRGRKKRLNERRRKMRKNLRPSNKNQNNKRSKKIKRSTRNTKLKRSLKSTFKLWKRWKRVIIFLFRIFSDQAHKEWLHKTGHHPQSHIRIFGKIHRYIDRAYWR